MMTLLQHLEKDKLLSPSPTHGSDPSLPPQNANLPSDVPPLPSPELPETWIRLEEVYVYPHQVGGHGLPFTTSPLYMDDDDTHLHTSSPNHPYSPLTAQRSLPSLFAASFQAQPSAEMEEEEEEEEGGKASPGLDDESSQRNERKSYIPSAAAATGPTRTDGMPPNSWVGSPGQRGGKDNLPLLLAHRELPRVYKPVQRGLKGQTERLFYSLWLPKLPGLQKFCAEFHGFRRVRQEDIQNSEMFGSPLQEHYIELEDLTAPFRRPNILDLKLGLQTWDEQATAEKREKESRKYPLQAELGFRCSGMQVYEPESKMYIRDYKPWRRQMTKPLVLDGIRRFLCLHSSDLMILCGENRRTVEDKAEDEEAEEAGEDEEVEGREGDAEVDARGEARESERVDIAIARLQRCRILLFGFMQQLRQLRDWFLEQRDVRFYASSVLFVYEGHPTSSRRKQRENSFAAASAAEDSKVRKEASPIIRLIDFGHVYRIDDGKKDRNTLAGVESVLSEFEALDAELQEALTAGAAVEGREER